MQCVTNQDYAENYVAQLPGLSRVYSAGEWYDYRFGCGWRPVSASIVKADVTKFVRQTIKQQFPGMQKPNIDPRMTQGVMERVQSMLIADPPDDESLDSTVWLRFNNGSITTESAEGWISTRSHLIHVPRVAIALYRGFTNKQVAVRLGDKLECLKAAKKTGGMSPDLEIWVSELEKNSSELYDKIAGVGLLKEREKPRTLKELLDVHRQRADVIEVSRVVWDKAAKNLREFFGEDKPIGEITPDDAMKFEKWLRTAPLNYRKNERVPYSASTVAKRLGNVKTFFYYAEKIGWLERNPFKFLKSGDTTNPEKLEYVPKELLLKVVETAPLRWRVILLFGRFCGLRGSSELYRMEWGDIHFSTAEEKGWVAVRAEKNKRHGRAYRVVPLPAVLETHLIRWAEQAPEGEKLVFPGMEKTQNFSVMTGKLAAKAGISCWKNPWYNLRKSFCTDLLPVVKDITTYEQITDHSYTVAAKHYQIMTGGRLASGMNQALEALDNIKQPEDVKEHPSNSVPESVQDLSKICPRSHPSVEMRAKVN